MVCMTTQEMTTQQKRVEKRRRDADNVRRFRNRRKQRAIEMLGGKCLHCGTTDGLMFCAKDVHGPVNQISKFRTSNEQAFLEEIERTVLLCENCYWKRMNESGRRKRWKHGTMYGFYSKECRCDLCVAANKNRNWNRNRRERAGSSTG